MKSDLSEMDMWREEIEQLRIRTREVSDMDDIIAFYGSSSIRLWETLADDLVPHKVINLGFGGSSYQWCDHYFDQVFEFLNPTKVILYAGDNDLGSEIPEAVIMQHIERILDKIQAKYGSIPMAIISVKPSPARLYLRQEIESLNAAMSSAIGQRNHGSFIDIHPAMLDQQGQVRPELFVEDQLHMNHLGYQIWGDVVGKHLDES